MYPTVGALIALLSYAKISFTEWIRYIYKYMLMIFVICAAVIAVAVQLNFS